MKAEHSPLTPRKLTENLERLTVRCVRLHFLTHHSLTAMAPADINECADDPSPCDTNAQCANSPGSYSCTCNEGFAGSGIFCEGSKLLKARYDCIAALAR